MPNLPRSWVDRLFERFTVIYGSQRVADLYRDSDREAVKELWARELGRFPGETVAAALQSRINSGSPWPPTLPEFIEGCRLAGIARRSEQTPALPAPSKEFSGQVLSELSAAVNKPQTDPRNWARKILKRHAEGDSSLAPIAVTMAKAALAAR